MKIEEKEEAVFTTRESREDPSYAQQTHHRHKSREEECVASVDPESAAIPIRGRTLSVLAQIEGDLLSVAFKYSIEFGYSIALLKESIDVN